MVVCPFVLFLRIKIEWTPPVLDASFPIFKSNSQVWFSDEGTLRSLQLRDCRSYDQLENTISFITTPVAREFDVLINENQKKDYLSRIVG
jgi:hypothetical protein